jgi:hypothetical protein
MRRTSISGWLPAIAAYIVIAGIVFLVGSRRPLEVALVPLIVVAGWAFVGHLITLDDDAAGAWSNPEGSRPVWRSSVGQLCLKGVAFVVILATVEWMLKRS